MRRIVGKPYTLTATRLIRPGVKRRRISSEIPQSFGIINHSRPELFIIPPAWDRGAAMVLSAGALRRHNLLPQIV